MGKVKINLNLLLPEIPDERHACMQRSISIMQKHKDIEKTHLIPGSEENESRLCFH